MLLQYVSLANDLVGSDVVIFAHGDTPSRQHQAAPAIEQIRGNAIAAGYHRDAGTFVQSLFNNAQLVGSRPVPAATPLVMISNSGISTYLGIDPNLQSYACVPGSIGGQFRNVAPTSSPARSRPQRHVLSPDIGTRIEVHRRYKTARKLPAFVRVSKDRAAFTLTEQTAGRRLMGLGYEFKIYTAHGLRRMLTLMAKYCDHPPLYRPSKIYVREGVPIALSTIADWVGKARA